MSNQPKGSEHYCSKLSDRAENKIKAGLRIVCIMQSIGKLVTIVSTI